MKKSMKRMFSLVLGLFVFGGILITQLRAADEAIITQLSFEWDAGLDTNAYIRLYTIQLPSTESVLVTMLDPLTTNYTHTNVQRFVHYAAYLTAAYVENGQVKTNGGLRMESEQSNRVQYQLVRTKKNTPIPFTLLTQAADWTTFQLKTNVAHGTLTGTVPNFVYTPNSNFFGKDLLYYEINEQMPPDTTDKEPTRVWIPILVESGATNTPPYVWEVKLGL